MADEITLATDDGDMPAYVATPDGDARGGIVVVQEAFGVTTHIQSVCRRLADARYTAIAPALFHRVGSPVLDYGDFEAVRPAMMSLTAGGIEVDLDAAFADLKGRGFDATRVGIVGFCMGGTVAFLSATRLNGLAAAVCYYGGRIAHFADEKPRCPTQMHFGEKDQGIPMTDVEIIKHQRPDCEVHVYADAGHGFHCDERASYHAPSAALAWERTQAFLKKHLAKK
jgi:carboxymethylenebutenolidase